jgi:hypothetical protein
LSNTSSPFCSGYFGDGGLTNYLLELASKCHPSNLTLLSNYEYRYKPPRLAQNYIFKSYPLKITFQLLLSQFFLYCFQKLPVLFAKILLDEHSTIELYSPIPLKPYICTSLFLNF